MLSPILACEDVAKAIEYYTEKLGFEKTMAMPGPDGVNTFAFVQLGASTVGLSRADTENVGNGVVFMVYLPEGTSIDDVYADVKSKGVPFAEELRTEYWGDRVFSVKDPDGFFISICQTVEETDMEHVEKVMRGEAEPNRKA